MVMIGKDTHSKGVYTFVHPQTNVATPCQNQDTMVHKQNLIRPTGKAA